MRKSYVKPVMAAEQFVANEYVSTCWWGPCNADGYVFNDYNSNGVIDGNDDYAYPNDPCTYDIWGDSGFFIKTEGTAQPPTNALVFDLDQLEYYYYGLGKIKVTGVKDSEKGNGTPAWRYKTTHTAISLNPRKKPNRS